MRACRAPNQLEGLVDVEPVPFRNDPLRLLDADAGLEGMLELGPALVGRMGDGQ